MQQKLAEQALVQLTRLAQALVQANETAARALAQALAQELAPLVAQALEMILVSELAL